MVSFRSDLAEIEGVKISNFKFQSSKKSKHQKNFCASGCKHAASRVPGRFELGIWCFFGAWTFALFLFLSSTVTASHAADSPDHSAALNSWLAAQTNIQTWSADFLQTRTLKALTQP